MSQPPFSNLQRQRISSSNTDSINLSSSKLSFGIPTLVSKVKDSCCLLTPGPSTVSGLVCISSTVSLHIVYPESDRVN